jgi:hypothetical protein
MVQQVIEGFGDCIPVGAVFWPQKSACDETGDFSVLDL